MGMYANLIAGEWEETAESSANINPSNLDDVIGEYASGNVRNVADAVAAAEGAARMWAATTPQRRFDVLDAAGTELLQRKLELGELLAREEGKTLPEGQGEVGRAGMVFKFFAGEALRISGDKVDSIRPGVEIEITREPLGIVGVITPWNFPIAIPAWKIAPALAFGNAVVFKPAALVPGSAWELAGILTRAGLPGGVFNLVMGRGSVVGEAMLDHPGIAGISFTGSVETGAHVAARCAARLAKVQLEMGGKNPLIVLDDTDLPTAVTCAVQGAFYSTGQRCTASSRLIVTEGIHDRFVESTIERMKTLRVGDALEAGTDIGPVVDQSQMEKDLEYLDLGKEEGAKLATGGQRVKRDKEGYYLEPALFTDTAPDMRINRDEIFGPIASVIRVKDYEEALSVANNTPFGLSGGICTTSLKHSSHYKKNAQVGMVMVNLPTAGVDYHVPFGGRKGSSYGSREQGRYAAEFYTSVKTSYVAP
jgi:acyl-CoA reductase-like NAD-dependent aldehyde dehydrogenase